MKVTLNKRLNVGYIEFKKAKITKTVKFRPNILIDVDRKGAVVGIEVLDLTLAPKLRPLRSHLRSISRTRRKVA